MQDIENIMDKYESFGPLPGILLPFIESLLPFLPLVAIVVANASAYGFWLGFLYSWIGVVTGAFSVFWLVRRFGGRFRQFIVRKYPKSQRLTTFFERKGFTLIFVLACFPFTPSSLVNIVSGLSRIPMYTFLTATMLGKGVMLMLVSYAGYDLTTLIHKPWKLVAICVVFLLLWLIGRKLESHFLNDSRS